MTYSRWVVSIVAFGVLIGAAGCVSDLMPTSGFAAAPESNTLAQPHRFTMRWRSEPGSAERWIAEVDGLTESELAHVRKVDDEHRQRLLAVHVGKEDTSSVPPMAGRYDIRDGRLVFEPRFPLQPGVHYRAVFRPGELAGAGAGNVELPPIESVIEPPATVSEPSTVVSRIYPTADLLPENLLKFYVYFSSPMSRGGIYEHIQLLNQNGTPVELPFLEIDEELWDPTMTRLTLFIDPGRIKRGVRPLEEIGPALEEGKKLTLVIDREWRDAQGIPLKETFRKHFHVGPPDRELNGPEIWKLIAPPSGSRAPLTIAFPEPVDHALAQRLILVTTSSGGAIPGAVSLSEHETRWHFVPNQPWSRGQYRIVVQTTLEDLAGNNIGKPFEVDIFERVDRHPLAPSVTREFEIP